MDGQIDSVDRDQSQNIIEVGEESLSYSELHILVCELYKDYLEKLKSLIEAVERTDDISIELRDLTSKSFEKDKWDEFDNIFSSKVIERASSINPVTHTFSLTDITYVRIAISRSLGDVDLDEPVTDKGKLFLKVDNLEREIISSPDFKGDACESNISLEDLLKVNGSIETLTEEEHGQCLEILSNSYQSQRKDIENKIATKGQDVATLKEETRSIKEGLTDLVAEVVQARDVLIEYHVAYQAYNEAQCEASSTWGLLEEKERLRYAVPSGHSISLENQLGKSSWGNHFDVFVLGVYDEQFYNHIHNQCGLSIQIFLDLANSASDIHLYSGSDGELTKRRKKDGPIFTIPKNEVLSWPRLDFILASLGH